MTQLTHDDLALIMEAVAAHETGIATAINRVPDPDAIVRQMLGPGELAGDVSQRLTLEIGKKLREMRIKQEQFILLRAKLIEFRRSLDSAAADRAFDEAHKGSGGGRLLRMNRVERLCHECNRK